MDELTATDGALLEQPSTLPGTAQRIGPDTLDVDSLVEQIWVDLDGNVERGVVERTVKDVLAGFRDVRVRSFLPIFIRKEVMDRLRVK
jgi:hypothetical protein